MGASILHITNGDSTTNYLKKLDFSGSFITWREMLCEGKTTSDIGSESFWKTRFDFFSDQDIVFCICSLQTIQSEVGQVELSMYTSTEPHPHVDAAGTSNYTCTPIQHPPQHCQPQQHTVTLLPPTSLLRYDSPLYKLKFCMESTCLSTPSELLIHREYAW